ncbi:MAG: hypothetical protein L6Q37_07630 [Bdellovibrionaceae bacterium]|nr:hypothetical protein [Pseudobdellovibrionaceae bacterium]NUM60313.1 hypothetical protein [Pseudobdellovibrionaceae bacterium]
MAALILSLLLSINSLADVPIRLILKSETSDFNHQLSVEEIDSQTLRITLNSNSFFSKDSMARIGVWKISSPQVSSFISSIKVTSVTKPEITTDRRAHTTRYWISGKKIHLDLEEVQAYTQIIKDFLMSINAELEEGFEFDVSNKKIRRLKNIKEPKFICSEKTKQCLFQEIARITF